MKRTLVFCVAGLVFLASSQSAAVLSPQNIASSIDSQRALVNQYCAGCHNDKLKSGGFSWTEVDLAQPERDAARIEKVIRKVRAGMMPPAGSPRPDAPALKAFASALETRVDLAASLG